MNRRGFLTGLVSIVAAPAIVRATSLMPIKALEAEFGLGPMLNAAEVQARLTGLAIYRLEWDAQWQRMAAVLLPPEKVYLNLEDRSNG